MDYVKACDICCAEFDERFFTPKLLDCGHSFCFSCIERLSKLNPKCPKCRKEFNRDLYHEYATNYSLIDALKLIRILDGNLVSAMNVLKNKIEAEKEFLTIKISQFSSKLEQAKYRLAQLQDLTDPENEILDFNKTIEVLASIENKHQTKSITHPVLSMLKESENINISNFENYQGYLLEIFKRLENEENIYAVKIIEGETKYGKVSLENNMILIHALTDTNKPESSSLIMFDDLKKCDMKINCFTFLKINFNESEENILVTIRMKTYTSLATEFIRICTGEHGPNYKMCSFQDNMIHEFGKYNGDFHLKGKKNEEYKIYKLLKDTDFLAVIGYVETPKNLNDYFYFNKNSLQKITDCGILFKPF